MAEKKTDLNEDLGSGKEPVVYELGYHILSSISEDGLEAEVAKVASIVKAQGGSSVADGFPTKIDLAYEISKKIDGKRHDFNSAYFGWMAFELSPDKIAEVKAQVEALPNVLRSLIIKTSKEDIAAAMEEPKTEAAASVEQKERLVADESNAGEVSEKALDEALEGIAA